MADTDPPDDLTADAPPAEERPDDRPPAIAEPADPPASCRYATIDLARGETVLYDRRNPRAWLRSDAAVVPATMA